MLRELGKLFGSENKVKLLRYFLANQESQISFSDLMKKVKIAKSDLKKELKNLVNVNFINEITILDEIEVPVKQKKVAKRSKGRNAEPVGLQKIILKQTKEDGFEFNKGYNFAQSLANLLLDFRFIDRDELLEDFKRYGKIKLLVLGGVFFRDEEGKLDLLIVGDALDKEKIDGFIKKLEADFGTELRYAVFESEEFRYRVNMFDRLLKDFWKRPHEKIIEKIATRP
jgi:DNA-binding Lrp family transcriptional regulator